MRIAAFVCALALLLGGSLAVHATGFQSWPSGNPGIDWHMAKGNPIGDHGWQAFYDTGATEAWKVTVYELVVVSGPGITHAGPWSAFSGDGPPNDSSGNHWRWIDVDGNPNPFAPYANGLTYSQWNRHSFAGGIGAQTVDAHIHVWFALNGWPFNAVGSPTFPDGTNMVANGAVVIATNCSTIAGTYSFDWWNQRNATSNSPFDNFLDVSFTAGRPAGCSDSGGDGGGETCDLCSCLSDANTGLVDMLKSLLLSLFVPSDEKITSVVQMRHEFEGAVDTGHKDFLRGLKDQPPQVPDIMRYETSGGPVVTHKEPGQPDSVGAYGFWIPVVYIPAEHPTYTDEDGHEHPNVVYAGGAEFKPNKATAGNVYWSYVRWAAGVIVYVGAICAVVLRLWPKFQV